MLRGRKKIARLSGTARLLLDILVDTTNASVNVCVVAIRSGNRIADPVKRAVTFRLCFRKSLVYGDRSRQCHVKRHKFKDESGGILHDANIS